MIKKENKIFTNFFKLTISKSIEITKKRKIIDKRIKFVKEEIKIPIIPLERKNLDTREPFKKLKLLFLNLHFVD